MRKVTVTVDPDGQVTIPGTRAGQTITIHVEPEPEPGTTEPGLAALPPEERERIIQELLEAGRQFRATATPEDIDRAVNHGDWLYGPDGLPR